MRSTVTVVLLLLAVPGGGLRAQQPDSTRLVRVFIDCRSRFCDFDHFRREIKFVSYVRDRQDADVHVFITTRRTGSGGTEFSYSFLGRKDYSGVDDSLTLFSSRTDTGDEIRELLTRGIALGMVRYVINTPVARELDVRMSVGRDVDEAEQDQVTHDPWNFWIFRVGLSGNVNGEEQQRRYAVRGGVTANRTTESWKIELRGRGRFSESRFELPDGSTSINTSNSYGTSADVIRSLGDHWGVGGTVAVSSSTFRNQDLVLEGGTGVEFNFFPYSESTRRALTLRYFVRVNRFNYDEETIFGKTEETQVSHSLRASYDVRQPWGSLFTALEGSNFLSDFSLHRVDFNAGGNIRIVRGFDFNIFGSLSRIKDQIHLPRQGVSDEEILLRLRELGTDYRYSLNLGFSYTFGSIFNNIVNPRFD